jgi:hypothetical protein
MFQAVTQFPVLFSAAARGINLLNSIDVPIVSIVDTKPTEIRVMQIGPCDDRGDDEKLGPEMETGAIEGIYRCDIASRALISNSSP